MHLVLCVKAVSVDLINMEIKDNNRLKINPYDIKVLKDVMQYKKHYDCKVTCLCMGSKDAIPMLKSCYGYGADEIILLNDPAFIGSDTYATSYILSKAIEKLGDYDFILFGERAVDGETGQVAGSVAEHLNIMHLSTIERVLLLKEDKAELELRDDSEKVIVELQTPAVLQYREFDSTELILGLFQVKRSRNKAPVVWNRIDLGLGVEQCGQAGSKTKVIEAKEIVYNKKDSKILEGSIYEQVYKINQLIINNRLV